MDESTSFLFLDQRRIVIVIVVACFIVNLLLKLKLKLNNIDVMELQSIWCVSCHVGSHSIACHPTQVNIPRLNPSQTGRYSIYYPGGIEGCVDLRDWLHNGMA